MAENKNCNEKRVCNHPIYTERDLEKNRMIRKLMDLGAKEILADMVRRGEDFKHIVQFLKMVDEINEDIAYKISYIEKEIEDANS